MREKKCSGNIYFLAAVIGFAILLPGNQFELNIQETNCFQILHRITQFS